MKNTVITALFLLIGTSAFAGQPKATLCQDQAVKGATALFKVNNPDNAKLTFTTELVSMDHSEGGAEVWDVHFESQGVQYSPYRMTVVIDACIITNFGMPFAG